MINVGTHPGSVAASVVGNLMMGNIAGGFGVEDDAAIFNETSCEGTGFVINDRLPRYHMMTSMPGGGSAGGASGLGGTSTPAGAGSPPSPKDPKRFLERTATPEGELKLLEDAMTFDEDGVRWMDMVRLGVAGDAAYAKLIDRPLVKRLLEMTSNVLAPEPDNFKTEKDAPWGGTQIAAEMKKGLGNWKPGLVVGESWEISGHPSFLNEFEFDYAGQRVAIDMGTLRAMFSKNLFGKRAAENEMTEMPFLVKLLNSGSWQGYISDLAVILSELDEREGADAWRKSVGVQTSLMELAGRNYDQIHQGVSKLEKLMGGDELADDLKALHKTMLAKNLSVQVHPTSDYKDLKEGEHSKTEAWIIVDAEKGAGIYLGLKEGVTKGEFEKTLEAGGDVTEYLNFVPVNAGDVFFIPAGTIHAIGAGVMLVEPQETSETTYRVYDYGRTDDKGRQRKLDVKKAIAVTRWDGLRGGDLVAALRRVPKTQAIDLAAGAVVENLVSEELFRTRRLTFGEGVVHEAKSEGIRGYTVLQGSVFVESSHERSGPREFLQGQSFIVPDATGKYTISGSSQKSILIETSEA
jgi:mannose-6-phosphate isomerase class I